MSTSEKESNFRLYYDIDKECLRNELYCTICGISIKVGQRLHEHPVLNVAVCGPCLLEYNEVNFSDNDLCTWCGENKNPLRKCVMCKAGFCKKCLSYNLGDRGKWEMKWLCLKCDTEPIWPLRNIFVKADLCSRKQRSSSQEKILSNRQPLKRLKRSKSIGCALPTERRKSVENRKFKEKMLKANKSNYETLQQFLRNLAKDLEFLIKESKSSVDDFKLDVFQPYTTQISQIKCWFSFLFALIGSINDNLNHFKSQLLKQCAECKEYDGITLLPDSANNPKEDVKSPNSMVLPSSSPLHSSPADFKAMQSTSQVKNNSLKKLQLNLKKRKLIFSSEESADEAESANVNKKIPEEIQQEKENPNNQNLGAENKLIDTEHKDEATILKELEDSRKKREKNKQDSKCSDSTEIYPANFLTALDSCSQLADSQETAIPPNFDGLEVCPETGNYIGGTVPDSSQSSNLGLADLTDSDTQSFVFDIPANLSKNEKLCDTRTSADVGDTLPEKGKQQVCDKETLGQDENIKSVESGICRASEAAAEVLEKSNKLELDASYAEEKCDIEEEKPREIDEIKEVKVKEDVKDQINKIMSAELDSDLGNVTIKEEYDGSTDEFSDLLDELDDNEKSTPSEMTDKRLKNAYEHLLNDKFTIDTYNRSESSLDMSIDDSFSDNDDTDEITTSKENEKVLGQVVLVPLPELAVQNDSLNKNDVEIVVINNVIDEKVVTDNAPGNLEKNKTFVPKDCSVILERLPKDFVVNKLKETQKKCDVDEDGELKRLMNLKTLDKKRTRSSSDEEKAEKRLKERVYKPKISQQNEMSCSSEDDQFDEDSYEEEEDKPVEIKENSETQESRDTRILEDILRQQKASIFLSSSSSEDDDSDEENNEEASKKKLRKDKQNKSEEDKNKKKKKTSSWRNDLLLRQTFRDSSDSDSDSFEEKKRKSISKRKEEFSGNDSDTKKSKAKRKRETSNSSCFTDDNDDIKKEPTDHEFSASKIIDSHKTIILLSSSDSDIEFITNPPVNIKTKSRKGTNKSASEKDEDSLKKKGRKNIRAIISDDVLEENTKKAIEEEKQRNKRVSQKQQLMSNFLSQSSENLEEEGLILDFDNETNKPLIVVNHNLTKRLKKHQTEGVKFMWSCCYESVDQIKQDNKGSGCILAHCMGLGKTFQVITLIHTLFKYQEETRTKRVLVVCPLSTVLNWDNEFKIAFKIASSSKNPVVFILGDQQISMFSKASVIKQWYEGGGILVMGYEAYSAALKASRYSQSTHDKVNAALVDPGPDLVILDEGHLLKNGKANRTTTLMQIKTKRRIILTGTPLQNNLKEYYHMVNFVKPNLLGSWLEYNNQFVNPIENGQYDDSTEEDVRKMKYRSHVLHKNLRRTIQRFEVSELETYLPSKLDNVLFIQLHPIQVQLYKAFLNNTIVDTTQSGLFSNYRYLQNIITHPYLLVLQDKMKNMSKDKNIKEIDTIDLEPEITAIEQRQIASNWWLSIIPEDVDRNIEYGPKFNVMLSIIEEAVCCGDKVLVFSNSLTELDGIEHFLKLVGTPSCRTWRNKIEYYRMDGTIKPESRMSLCMSFNNPKNTQTKVFLVSHKVGGLGLNLVAANRVILMDVNWNPSSDSQSIFRTYRFGQKKKCFVYRLVSMGTMEEVVYERSVTKLAIAGRVVDERQISRHYRSSDLLKMYRANFDLTQPRPNLNVPEDVVLGKVYQRHTKELFKYHSHQSLLENLPHESLTKEEMERAWLEFGKENEAAKKIETAKKAMENAKKLSDEMRYHKNIQTINALAEDVANKEEILNNYMITSNNGNFVTIPAAYQAFVKDNSKNFSVISNQRKHSHTTPSTEVGHFEEVYVPVGQVDIDGNDNRDNDVIVLEDNPLNNHNSVTVANKSSTTKNSKTDNSFKPPLSLPNNNRFHQGNRANFSNSKKTTPRRIVPRPTVTEVPQEVIDVENHSLLAMLAKNQDISVSQILKPKNLENGGQNDRGKVPGSVSDSNVILLP